MARDRRPRGSAAIVLLVLFASLVLGAVGLALLGSSVTSARDAVNLGQPLTPLSDVKPGGPVRAEGRLERTAGFDLWKSASSGTTCLAFWVRVQGVSERQNDDGKTERSYTTIYDEKRSPDPMTIAWGEATLLVPASRWTTPRFKSTEVRQEPAFLRERIGSTHYNSWLVQEEIWREGQPVFVAGIVRRAPRALPMEQTRPGPVLEVETDPVLSRVELFGGTQAQLVSDLRSSSHNMRIAAYIVWGVMVLVDAVAVGWWLIRRGKRGAKPR